MSSASSAPARRPETGNKHALRRQATRAELLDLGVARFPLKGFAATTIDDLVRDSGYSRGAVYFHFGDKETFFLEVLRHRATYRKTWWQVVLDASITSLEEAVRAALSALAATDDPGSRSWPLMIGEFVQTLPADSEHRAGLDELYEGWLEELGHFVDALHGRGFVRTDIDARRLAMTILAAFDGASLHAVAYPAFDPAGMPDLLVRLLRP